MNHFAVVGEGSPSFDSFLAYYLSKWPVTILSHLFDRSDYERMDAMETAGTLIKVGDDPGEFLDSILDPQKTMVVVVRYNEVRDNEWSLIWPYLRREMPIVHFKYRNLLELHAQRVHTYNRMYFDIEVLEGELRALESNRQEHDELLKYAQVREVWREDLLNDAFAVMTDLGSFLGVEAPQDYPVFIQGLLPEEMIENYAEVQRCLTQSPT